MISRDQLSEIVAREKVAQDKGISLNIMKSYYKFRSIYQGKQTFENHDKIPDEIHNKVLHDLDGLINSLRPEPKPIKYLGK